MTDTIRPIATILTSVLQDGQVANSISPQDLRDVVVTFESRSIKNVKEYGALGDGSNDDTSSINAAVTAAAAGGTITFSPGTYNISNTITIAKALHIDLQSGATIFLVNGSNNHMLVFSVDDITISGGGVLDLNGANNSGGGNDFECVQIGANFCSVKDIELKNYVYAGVGIHGASYNSVENCYIHTAVSGTGVFMNFSSLTGSTNNIIKNNRIDTPNDGVWSGGNNLGTALSSGNIISNNYITSHRIGIEVWGGSPYSVITGNHIIGIADQGFGWGISAAASDYTSVTGNTINAASFAGIEFAASSNVTGTGNTINGNGTLNTGFSISDGTAGTNIVVSSNTINNCTKGIYTSCHYTFITGNTILNATSNGIEANGANHVTVVGNYIQSTSTTFLCEESSFVLCANNMADAGDNGFQATANSGTTRDYIYFAKNIITAATNQETFTGAHFGHNIHEDFISSGSSTHYFLTTDNLVLGPIVATRIDGTGVNEGSLWNGGVVRVTGGQSGSGGGFINFKNDNSAFGQIGISSHTLGPYHGQTGDSMAIYTSHDIALVADGGVVNFGTAGGLQAQIANTGSATNNLTLTGSATTGVGGSIGASAGAVGFSTNVARSSTASISAAGTNSQANSTALTTDTNHVSTAAANSGVRLPTAVVGMEISVINRGASTMHVYPATGGAIDALGSNAAFDMLTNTSTTFRATSTTQWWSF